LNLKLSASAIGKKASDLMTRNNQATLAGVTSRGVFLRFPSGWIIFLSTERYRGPLSVNLIDGGDVLGGLNPGQPVWIAPREISFPSLTINLSIDQTCVWQAPERSGKVSPIEAVRSSLEYSLKLVLENELDPDFRELVLAFLNDEVSAPVRFEQARQAIKQISKFSKQLDLAALEAAAGTLFGLGSGLTPWGDDLLLGLLLALNRWGDRISADFNPMPINQALVRYAWARTTNLSASLIECAAIGQADERLVAVLDSILTGEPDIRISTLAALGWGSSSGAASLLGMALVLI